MSGFNRTTLLSIAMISPLQYVIQRLSALSLFTSRIDAQSRSPSFWPVVLPSLLRHLKPSSGSLLASYPSTFFPSILLALPTSTLVTVVSSLIHHLAQHTTDLPYDSPSDLVRRAATVFSLILGKAEAGKEAMDAVLQTLLSPDAGTGTSRHALIRIVVAWISQSAEKGKSIASTFFLSDWDRYSCRSRYRYGRLDRSKVHQIRLVPTAIRCVVQISLTNWLMKQILHMRCCRSYLCSTHITLV